MTRFGIQSLLSALLVVGTTACGTASLPSQMQFRRPMPMHPLRAAQFRRFNSELPPEAAPLPNAKRLDIRLFRTFASPEEVILSARTIEYQGEAPSPDDSKWRNILRNLNGITVYEQAEVKVRFSLNGRAVYAVSDKDGMIRLNTREFGMLAPGRYSLEAQIAGGQKFTATPVSVPLYVHEAQRPSLGIISDIDDTVKHMNVSNKLAAAKKLFFQSPFEAQAIPATPLLYQLLEERIDDQRDDGDIFYLSGSPLNFSPQIYAFLDHQRFPQGSVTLKKWGFGAGSDNPLAQSDYKLRSLRAIFEHYPQRQFFLFGDSSEADAEIYTTIAREFPGRVKGIFINNVTGASPQDPKYQGVNLTRNSLEAAVILQQMGVLTPDDVGAVQQAMQQTRN